MMASRPETERHASSEHHTKAYRCSMASRPETERHASSEHHDHKMHKMESVRLWVLEEETAENMVPIIGSMYRQNILLTLHHHSLAHKSPINIIKIHAENGDHKGRILKVSETWPVVQELKSIQSTLRPMSIDLGSLTHLVLKGVAAGGSVSEIVRKWIRLSDSVAVRPNPMETARDVVLYGFGRIGRLLARILIEKRGGGSQLMLRAIVVRRAGVEDLEKRALLLQHDSVHKGFQGRVEVDSDKSIIIANGKIIHMIHADQPEEPDYTRFGIKDAVIIDNTGKYRTREELSRHLKASGVGMVLLTAPGKGDVPQFVHGVNTSGLPDSHRGERIFSAASCSTNAVVPVLQLMEEGFGVISGHIETVHAFTNDQNLLDNFHKKERRGRSAVLNMVLTGTGAAEAVAKVLPDFAGKLTASAVRVPTPNVSMAILILQLQHSATVEEVNKFLQERAVRGPLMHQVDFSVDAEAVSSDFVGTRAAGVIDGPNTIVKGNQVNLYVWYDNEFGYSCQVIRLVQRLCRIVHPPCPPVLPDAAIGASSTEHELPRSVSLDSMVPESLVAAVVAREEV